MPETNNFFSELGLLLYTTPTYAFLIILELTLSNWQGKKMYSFRDTLTNLYLTVFQMLVDVAMRLVTIYALDSVFLPHHFLDIQNVVLYWVVLTVAQDFCFYWIHRTEHSSRFFWAVHVTHHSSDYFNLSVGFRSSVFEPIYRFLFFIPLPLLGFKALDIFLVFSATQIYGLLVHTQYIRRIPIYEWIFVTPSHHRVHHASNVRYLDKNLGMFLIIWDRMFGTYADEIDQEPVVYGLHKPAEKDGMVKVVMHEWYSIGEKWRETADLPLSIRLKYVFKAPGWSHDGSTKTAVQYRKEVGLK